jgi:hypothetical protein
MYITTKWVTILPDRVQTAQDMQSWFKQNSAYDCTEANAVVSKYTVAITGCVSVLRSCKIACIKLVFFYKVSDFRCTCAILNFHSWELRWIYTSPNHKVQWRIIENFCCEDSKSSLVFDYMQWRFLNHASCALFISMIIFLRKHNSVSVTISRFLHLEITQYFKWKSVGIFRYADYENLIYSSVRSTGFEYQAYNQKFWEGFPNL